MIETVPHVDAAGEPHDDERTYRDLAPELIRFATALVGPSDAADVLASAFVKAIGARSWSSVENRRAYLYRVVHNEARSHHRRSARRRDRESVAAAGRSDWELPGLRPDVAAAVRRLSVQQRAVIVLTYWADLDPAAVARRLGIGEGSVRRHLARARANLRKVLHDD